MSNISSIATKPLIFMMMASCAVGCGKKKKSDDPTASITPALSRIDAKTATGLVDLVRPEMMLTDVETRTNDVTISSLKLPIGSISLVTAPTDGTTASTNSTAIYTCSGATNDACLVEVASGTALANLLPNATPTSVPDGTYNGVSISPCVGNLGASAVIYKLTATVTIGGTKYYTNTTSGLSTTSPAQEVSIPAGGGCGAISYLMDTLYIASGAISTKPTATTTSTAASSSTSSTSTQLSSSAISLPLYFDIANAAYASGGTTNTGAGTPSNGCFGADAQHPYICLNFPSIVGTIDTTAPTVKRFLMTGTGFGGTIFGFYYGSSSDIPFGAYQRVYYSGAQVTGTFPENLLGPSFKRFAKNTDGTLAVGTFGDWLTISNFQTVTHTGSVVLNKAPFSSTSTLNGTMTYTATLIN